MSFEKVDEIALDEIELFVLKNLGNKITFTFLFSLIEIEINKKIIYETIKNMNNKFSTQ